MSQASDITESSKISIDSALSVLGYTLVRCYQFASKNNENSR